VLKLALNSMYGKMYQGGRVLYAAADGIVTTDMYSAYPDANALKRVASTWRQQQL
jgi:hypothetical protein